MAIKPFDYSEFMGDMDKLRQNILNLWRRSYPIPVTTFAKEVGVTNVTARAFLIERKSVDFTTLCAFQDWFEVKKIEIKLDIKKSKVKLNKQV